ncbi:MAG: rod shape-determining protein MreC [Bacteroidales bacterium]
MRRLFSYILKHSFTLLFLLLELTAFLFIIQNNYQRASIINSSNRFTGSVFNSYHNITQYLTLKDANELLMEENIKLRKQLEESFLITDTNTYYQQDSLFKFVGATVINNSVQKQTNYLMLNKGYKQGIRKDMGVITTNGVVGTIVEVSENYSRVMSVLHIRNRINARIKKNNHLGNMEWDGYDYRIGLLTDIPTHVALAIGDTIVTSGNSDIFPANIAIGTVEKFNSESNKKFNTAEIKYTVDYNKVYHVYIVVNLMREEIDQLNNMDD